MVSTLCSLNHSAAANHTSLEFWLLYSLAHQSRRCTRAVVLANPHGGVVRVFERLGYLLQMEALCQPPNQQLRRTVIPQHVRAASAALPLCARGAHHTASRGR